MTAPIRIDFAPVRDLTTLAAEWQALEAEADASFFQSWTWVGCRAAERFAAPWRLRVERDGRCVGLALLNRRHGAFWLHESGDPGLDAIYIEHNGVLLACTAADLLAPCLGALLAPGRRLVLSGVDAAELTAARRQGVVRLRRHSLAPYVDLAALPAAPEAYLASLSANTRQQLRRSDRRLGGSGGIVVTRAATVAEAVAFLDALAVLHQATWTARGRPGAFANPAFLRFHRALLARAVPNGEADLLRISGVAGVIGYLYNFRRHGRVLTYQSGFDYAAAGRHGKPGLTCHHAAITAARADGATVYDFLAGADRYKTSLATAATRLYWLEAAAAGSLAGLRLRLADTAARLRTRLRRQPVTFTQA